MVNAGAHDSAQKTPHKKPPVGRVEAGASVGLVVVGVGASAGGLEALQSMLSNLPTDTGMAFVVAQHLSPSYKSMMVDLLEKSSTIPVSSPEHGERLLADHVYICPPNRNIELDADDTIALLSYSEVSHTPRPSVDMLFESIAQIKRDKAVGIVLSGTGTDGSRGIRAIKGENGFGIVQDPKDAKFDGMPESAINSGNVDLILQATEIGEELSQLIHRPRPLEDEDEINVPREIYSGIIFMLKKHCKVDFGLYKENTILRRIERRMTSLKIPNSTAYLHHLQSHQDEVYLLFNDMLIGVTSFFRDNRPFEALKRELEHYIKAKSDNVLRIWCVGCSTGEEPYSISMILHEILGERISEYAIQIFATDIDKNAIHYARNAKYPESALKKLPSSIRNKYFNVSGEQFEVVKKAKANVIFSVHDVNNDPPFLRLDLITCRNLMIYFNVELQNQLLATFHYALHVDGLLMLGQSESVGVYQEQYRALSKTAKIYQSVFFGKQLPPHRKSRATEQLGGLASPVSQPQTLARRSKLDREFATLIGDTLKEHLLPAALLVNANLDIIFTEGAHPLLVRPEGLPSNNIYKNIHPQLVVDLRTAFHSLQNGASNVDIGFQPLVLDGKEVLVRLLLIGLTRPSPVNTVTVIFAQIEQPDSLPLETRVDSDAPGVDTLAMREQHRQLLRTKEQLQDVIEELETSNEDMQSMNEELQSSNEELQSTNEELETTNEELQSTNEELQTAYAELRMAYEEREQQRNELEQLRVKLEQSNSLLEEAERQAKMGSWLWDVPSRRLDWSKGCYALFDFDHKVFHPTPEAFIGIAQASYREALERHLTDLLHNNAKQPFIFEATNANKETVTISLEAVVSFNELKQAVKVMGSMRNITEQVMFQRQSEGHKEKINYILSSSLTAAFVIDLTSQSVGYINPEFNKLFGHSLEGLSATSGSELLELFHPDDRSATAALFSEVARAPRGTTSSASYRIKTAAGDFLAVHANHTVYEVDETTGVANKLLVMAFAASP